MKNPSLLQVCVATTQHADEAVAEVMAEELGRPCSTFTDFRRGVTVASVYLPGASHWSLGRKSSLQARLRTLKAAGINIGTGRITTRQLPREDWAESWKRHFKPITIGRSLLVKPSWSRRQPRPGQEVVILDPGLSFGTGQHPTTRFCLEQLLAWRRKEEEQAFLDIGTGSGILAIAAAKLGYGPVIAFDNDPEAVRRARENTQTNQVKRQVWLANRDLTRLGVRTGRFAVVCANLIADLLLKERRRLLALVEPGGVLILAGILSSQFPEVCRAYQSRGARLACCRRQGEWESGAFVLRP
jgi:ribosomal protein L11 methyltransferase